MAYNLITTTTATTTNRNTNTITAATATSILTPTCPRTATLKPIVSITSTQQSRAATTTTAYTKQTLQLPKQQQHQQQQQILLQQQQRYKQQQQAATLRMITEPMNEYCKAQQQLTNIASSNSNSSMPAGAVRLGISRSQEEEGVVRSGEQRQQDREHLLAAEQRFGSISPIGMMQRAGGGGGGGASHALHGVNSMSALGAMRATNFRLKFRKSHTCGSLFANCHCSESSPTELLAPRPLGSGSNELLEYMAAEHERERQRERRSSATLYQQQHHYYAVSPTPSSVDGGKRHSSSSSSNSAPTATAATANTTATSGYLSSLSTQTSSATTISSAQLSRDESTSASFDFVTPIGSGGGGGGGGGGVSGGGTADAVLPDSVSLALAKHANGSTAIDAHKLQVPPRISPTPQHDQQQHQQHHLHQHQLYQHHHNHHNHQQPHLAARKSPLAVRASKSVERPAIAKRLFQSYSHPDTNFIFTDANKSPSQSASVDKVITARGGKVEIKQPSKRLSSPHIGQCQVLDVAVHPDILVKISPKHSTVTAPAAGATTSSPTPHHTPLSVRSVQQRRRLLQRSHEIDSAGSTSDSTDSFDVNSPIAVKRPLSGAHTPPVSPTARQRSHSPNTSNNSAAGASASGGVTGGFDAAQKYFAESGILGPINTTNNLIRKTSKILQDANVIEQIRKTSMILRANNSNRKTSTTTSTTSTLTPTPPDSPAPSQTTASATTAAAASPLALKCQAAATTTTTTATTNGMGSCIDVANGNRNGNSHVVSSMETPASIIYAPATPQSPHTMATTCGFGPNVTSQSCCAIDDRDVQIKNLQGECVSLKDVIKSRDAEIVKLRREIHKLKSVLQQTTNHLPIASDDLLQSPTSPTKRCFMPTSASLQSTEISSTQATVRCTCCQQRFDAEQGNNNTNNNNNVNNGKREWQQSATDSSESSSAESSHNAVPTYNGNTSAAACALAAAPQQAHAGDDKANEIASDAALTASDPRAVACNGNASSAAASAIAGGSGGGGGAGAAGMDRTSSHGSKSRPKLCQMGPVLKKQGVSAESCETITLQQSINTPIPKYDKDYSAKQLIKEAIMDNDFLKNIDASQVRELVDSMCPLSIAKGEFVIREGEAGSHLYVSAEGEFEVIKNGNVLGVMGPGKAFGELAILYNCTRTASIRVLCDARCWVLDRRVFQQIMMRTGLQRIENSVNFLKSVPLLKNLSEEVLAKIADVLEVEFYPAGTYIIRQGASGDTFFIISQGSVKVTQKPTPSSEEQEIRTLQCGDYFGEQALINEDKRTANIIALAPGVECLTLDRDSFTHLIGDLCELKEKNYGDENRTLAMKFTEKNKEIFGANVRQEFPEMKLTDLEVVATLGIGGFGRVELVKAYRDNRVDIFALKCLKKRHIVDTKQEEHVYSERTIMLSCNTPFICRLHRTFRDDKYVYMLLEACMGGEIWTMLRDRGSFDDNATQFIIGCVLQAFEYLHARGIIYRDLKPENLMLDERGYVKLVDFGFAKYIGNSSKTWTFCGTPEYVAPEIILNKGHDRAVDYWALGILIHELLNGTPPFTSHDPMKTYNIILKGIDMIPFPKHMSRSAVQLIKRLCRDVPAERLGYQKGGIQDIKKHKWFLGFDWDGLASQLLIPPFVRPIAHPTDTSYFDKFPCDDNEPPDEFTGWDADF